MGVLKWVDWTVSEPRYFQLQTDHTPVHLALLDEVGAGGPHAARSGSGLLTGQCTQTTAECQQHPSTS